MHTSPVAHAPEDGLLPGPELDRLVAEALGVVPCDAWVPTSLGSAGGLAVMSDGCPHAHGACYPTVTHGPAGGLPPWSQPDGRYRYDRLTVDDLPPDHALLRQADGSYVVLALAANGRVLAQACTEPLVLALAVLELASEGTLVPRFTDETRWHPRWRPCSTCSSR